MFIKRGIIANLSPFLNCRARAVAPLGHRGNMLGVMGLTPQWVFGALTTGHVCLLLLPIRIRKCHQSSNAKKTSSQRKKERADMMITFISRTRAKNVWRDRGFVSTAQIMPPRFGTIRREPHPVKRKIIRPWGCHLLTRNSAWKTLSTGVGMAAAFRGYAVCK